MKNSSLHGNYGHASSTKSFRMNKGFFYDPFFHYKNCLTICRTTTINGSRQIEVFILLGMCLSNKSQIIVNIQPLLHPLLQSTLAYDSSLSAEGSKVFTCKAGVFLHAELGSESLWFVCFTYGNNLVC